MGNVLVDEEVYRRAMAIRGRFGVDVWEQWLELERDRQEAWLSSVRRDLVGEVLADMVDALLVVLEKEYWFKKS